MESSSPGFSALGIQKYGGEKQVAMTSISCFDGFEIRENSQSQFTKMWEKESVGRKAKTGRRGVGGRTCLKFNVF